MLIQNNIQHIIYTEDYSICLFVYATKSHLSILLLANIIYGDKWGRTGTNCFIPYPFS